MTRTLSKYPISVGTKLFFNNSSNNMWEWLSTMKIVESSVRLILPREVGIRRDWILFPSTTAKGIEAIEEE